MKMEYIFSDKAKVTETGIFARLTAKKSELAAAGRKTYDLYIGTPDFPTPKHIIDAVVEASKKPENYKYALIDLPEMLDALVKYYKKRYGVDITPDEAVSVHGSQDGIGHLGLAMCNPDDYVLLPDPGYPVFEAGVKLSGAKIYYYKLLKKNKFLPDMTEIPEEILRKVKYMIVSYPSNPCGAAAPKEMYYELIEYANKYNFFIINDNAYSDIIFDGREGYSFLSIPGAKEVGIEFFSLSKSFDTTGARISFAVGNKHIIDAIKVIRSQYDFGMFLPVQYGAIAALTGETDSVKAQCEEYRRRRDALCGGFRKIGWDVPDSDGTMFVWAPIPAKYESSEQFWETMVEKTGIICTPGSAFGPAGEGYVRFALVKPAEELAEIAKILGESGII